MTIDIEQPNPGVRLLWAAIALIPMAAAADDCAPSAQAWERRVLNAADRKAAAAVTLGPGSFGESRPGGAAIIFTGGERLDVTAVRQKGTTYTFELGSGDAKSTLTLKYEARRAELFYTDTSRPGGPDQPSLYKELVFDGKVKAGGALARTLGKGAFDGRLVVHGQGNRCIVAGQFYKWTLRMRAGRRIDKKVVETRLLAVGKVGGPGGATP